MFPRLHLTRLLGYDATMNGTLGFLPLLAYDSCGWSYKNCQAVAAKPETHYLISRSKEINSVLVGETLFYLTSGR